MILLGTLVEGQRVTSFGGSPRIAAISSCFIGPSWRVPSETFLVFQAWFLVGRRFGRPLLESRPHRARRIANMQDWFGHYETMPISRSASWRAWIASAP
jgi:hypothetical protein